MFLVTKVLSQQAYFCRERKKKKKKGRERNPSFTVLEQINVPEVEAKDYTHSLLDEEDEEKKMSRVKATDSKVLLTTTKKRKEKKKKKEVSYFPWS